MRKIHFFFFFFFFSATQNLLYPQCVFYEEACLKDVYRLANSVDPVLTAISGAV